MELTKGTSAKMRQGWKFGVWVVVSLAFATGVTLSAGCQGTYPGDEGLPPRRAATVYDGHPVAPPVQLSLHRSPLVFAPEAQPYKEIQLDMVGAAVDLGTEGRLGTWSFGGQIPGPTLRVREGDRVRFIVTNQTGEALAGAGAPVVARSLDLGGAFLVDRQDEGRSIAPGQTLELDATWMVPGVHLYTGGPTPAEAVIAGLYGMVIVDPVQGYDTRAQREYALVQGELYARVDPAGRRLQGAPLAQLDRDALKGKRPSHVGYNGRFATAGEHLRLSANPGERLRFFVLDVGPNVPGRFQVPEVPFDRVWPADLLGEKATPASPARLEPGRGAVVEMVLPRNKKARYRFLDRQFGDRGLWAVIDAAQGEPEPPTAAMLAAMKPRTPAERRARGHEIFGERCASCHLPPEGTMRMAPSLDGVLQRRPRQWLVSWLTDPPKMQAEDPTALELMKQWNNIPMPPVMLSPDQIEWVLEFLASGPGTGKKG
jgi:nitrite reductase (NO-forming)